jgi:hypothetical protein
MKRDSPPCPNAELLLLACDVFHNGGQKHSLQPRVHFSFTFHLARQPSSPPCTSCRAMHALCVAGYCTTLLLLSTPSWLKAQQLTSFCPITGAQSCDNPCPNDSQDSQPPHQHSCSTVKTSLEAMGTLLSAAEVVDEVQQRACIQSVAVLANNALTSLGRHLVL